MHNLLQSKKSAHSVEEAEAFTRYTGPLSWNLFLGQLNTIKDKVAIYSATTVNELFVHSISILFGMVSTAKTSNMTNLHYFCSK